MAGSNRIRPRPPNAINQSCTSRANLCNLQQSLTGILLRTYHRVRILIKTIIHQCANTKKLHINYI